MLPVRATLEQDHIRAFLGPSREMQAQRQRSGNVAGSAERQQPAAIVTLFSVITVAAAFRNNRTHGAGNPALRNVRTRGRTAVELLLDKLALALGAIDKRHSMDVSLVSRVRPAWRAMRAYGIVG